jgi:hypothetical protein
MVWLIDVSAFGWMHCIEGMLTNTKYSLRVGLEEGRNFQELLTESVGRVHFS